MEQSFSLKAMKTTVESFKEVDVDSDGFVHPEEFDLSLNLETTVHQGYQAGRGNQKYRPEMENLPLSTGMLVSS